MRILCLTAYSFPEQVAGSYLGENRSRAFAAEGWETVVYTPTPSRGIDEATRELFKRKDYRDEKDTSNHRTVHRFPMFPEGTNTFMRVIRYGLCALIHLFKGIFAKNARECNIVFVVSTPPIQGAVAALVKIVRHIPFVYNLQDIFPDSLVAAGLANRNGLIWKIGRLIEDFTYRHADKIIVISEDFKKNIMAKGVPEEKIEVVYNWVDEKAVVDIPRSENILFERYGLDKNKFYITYNGNIGLTQNLDMLIEVAISLKMHEDIHFVLVGNGIYLSQLSRTVAERKLKNVTLLPFQPYEEISYVFSLGDVSLVISKPMVGTSSIPSKTWSIMSASRPVLASFDENELKTIIEDNHCGIFTKAGDKEAFVDAIMKLYNDRELCKEMGRNGRKFVMENLTKEIGTKKYVEIIKSFDLQ